jgi:hypothetical protein
MGFDAVQSSINVTTIQRNLLSPSTLKATELGCYVRLANIFQAPWRLISEHSIRLYVRSVRYNIFRLVCVTVDLQAILHSIIHRQLYGPYLAQRQTISQQNVSHGRHVHIRHYTSILPNT